MHHSETLVRQSNKTRHNRCQQEPPRESAIGPLPPHSGPSAGLLMADLPLGMARLPEADVPKGTDNLSLPARR